MKKSNWAVGEAYTMNTARDPRKRNIHDPHNQYVWADAEPAWFKVLQVLGVIAGAVSMFTLLWLFTVILFLV